jgi:nicotinamide mononucleotide adenylyltransferase
MIIKKNSLLISIILMFFTQQLFANEKIGTVNKIEGNLKAINESGEERELSVYDELYLLDEIVSSNGGATIQFDDNSTIILKNNTSFKVTEFNISGAKDIFVGETIKGSVIVESGKIAKSDSGLMQIKLPKMDLEVKGTRFNIENKPDGTSDVGLSKDSFGNVGTINIAAEGAVKTLYSPDQVVSISEGQGFTERPQSDEEKQSMETVSQDLVEASKIDENEIQKQLEKKLLEGKLEDADGDGKIDLNDIAAIKQSIKEEKQEQINFIVDNSKEDNTTFLSEVLNSSDESNVGEVMNKIVENNDALISQVVSDLSDKDNKFITGSDSEVANQIKEKVFEKIVQSGSDKSAEVLSKVIAKSDPKTVESVITNITTKNTDTNSALSLKVMADLAEKNPEALEVVNQNNKEQMEKLVVDAVQKGSGDEGSANLIAKVVSSASAEVTNKMISEVSNNNSGVNSDLSAKVLKAIVETAPEKIQTIDNSIKEKAIEQAVVSASISKDKNNDFGNVISDVIVKSDAATAAKVMEKISNSNDSSGLALKVMASVSEKDDKKLEEVSKKDSSIINKLVEKSVKEIKGTGDEVKLLAKVISKSTDQKLTEKILVETAKKSTIDKTIMANVATATIKENSNTVQSLAVTISTNQNIIENLVKNPEVIKAENILSVFAKNVSPN